MDLARMELGDVKSIGKKMMGYARRASPILQAVKARRAEKRSAFRRRITHTMMAQCPIVAATVYRAAPVFHRQSAGTP